MLIYGAGKAHGVEVAVAGAPDDMYSKRILAVVLARRSVELHLGALESTTAVAAPTQKVRAHGMSCLQSHATRATDFSSEKFATATPISHRCPRQPDRRS